MNINLKQEFRDAKTEFERAYVERVLKETSGNMSEAARLAGKDRKDFYDLTRRTGVDPVGFRTKKAAKA